MSEVEPSPPHKAVPVHRIRRMSGRDPHEPHRVATPLELLFDLTFVIAFGIAANEFAHEMAEGHIGAGLAAFAFATFAICLAWINFSWFASAYDTDDWIYRLMTMLQMVGVIILALGLPQSVQLDRRRRTHRQSRDGRRLRGHADRAGGAVVTCGQAGSAAARGVPDLRGAGHRRADRLDRNDIRRAARLSRRMWRRWRWRVSSCSSRGWPSGAGAAHRGTPTTSPSATGCWPSSRWARAWSAPSPRCRRSSGRRAGPWPPPLSRWREPG